MITFYRITLVSLFVTCNGFSQTILETSFQRVVQQPLPDFLNQVEQQHPVKIFYLEEWLSMYEVGPQFNGYTLRRLLDELLHESDIRYDLMFGYALIFARDPSAAIERESLLNRAVIERKTVEQRVIGDKRNYKPGVRVTLSGTLRDQDTGKPMEGATVTLNEKEEKLTDRAGHFQFSIMPGAYVLIAHQSQYDDKVIDLEIYQSGGLDVELQETPIMLGEVVIADELLLDKAIGKTALNIGQIKRVPVFLGEVDIIKQVQSQPGVTTVGEIASGFNVRGGSVDQNLVLYDDVPVFNTSHALGFFTAFNSDAIREVSFYRGGVPARYGGRVSSVLDIGSREGDLQKWKGAGGIGIISSHLTVGGPIRKDTTSVLLSIRSTYSNWMLKAVKSNYKDLRNTAVNFYDGSLKLSHQLTDKSKLTFSGYRSNDEFSLADDTTFHWSNTVANLRFDRTLSEKLFASASLSYGKYDFRVSEADSATAFDLEYAIVYPSLKFDFHLDGESTIAFGLQNTFYTFEPGSLNPASEWSNAVHRKMDAEQSLESAIYFTSGFNVTEKLFVEAGLRLSLFNRFGPEAVYQYSADAPREVRNIQDSVVYGAREISKSYAGAEPRIFLRYNLDQNTSLKFGYHRMAQYMHLITNTAAMMPTDIWQSSNAYFKPQLADQISVGIFRNYRESMFETFIEAYVKNVKNTLDFKDGADLILNSHLETALISTTSKSYGAEFSVAKISGRLQGTLNYTYSRSFRKGEGVFESDQVNRGKRYPANHDQPNVVNLNWRYAFSRRFYFSGNFAYHTGRPVSMPASFYRVDGVPISDFAERNQYRIPDYHRLDIAFILEGNHKRKKPWSGHWVFSFYNVYGRRNAYSVFFADDGEGVLKPYRLSVIGTMIPSVSYSFKL